MELRRRSHLPWAIAAAVVAVVLILAAAALFVFNSLRSLPGDMVDGGFAAAGRLRELAGAFQQGRVETTFISYAAEVSGTNFLQVATLKQVEVYTREDQSSLLWGRLALPDVVVAATVPVEYAYFLDLEEPWSFHLEDDVLWVNAPPIRFNTPSLDVSQLHFDVRESSLLRDEDTVVEQLRLGLMELSRRSADDHVGLIRETARRRTGDFVRTWLAGSFSDAGRYRVEVWFDGEQPDVTIDAARN